MLTFTTSKPYSVVAQAFSKKAPPPAKIKRRKAKTSIPEDLHLGIYIHGDAQSAAGFDIPKLVEGRFSLPQKFEGKVIPCILELPNEKIACNLYIWLSGHIGTSLGSGKPVRFCHGLIVSDKDERSIAYAKQKMKEKAFSL